MYIHNTHCIKVMCLAASGHADLGRQPRREPRSYISEGT